MPGRRTLRPGSLRRGMTLLDTALALVVVAIAAIAMAQMTGSSNSRIRDAAAASSLQFVGNAAQSYVQTMGQTLAGCMPSGSLLAIPVGVLSAGAPSPSIIPANSPCAGIAGVGSLQAEQFLPANFVDSNAWGQHDVLLVKKTANGTIEAMVATYGPVSAATSSGPTDTDLGAIASMVGVQAGYYPQSPTPGVASGSVTGAFGSWQETASAWTQSVGSFTVPAPQHLVYNLGFQAPGTTDFVYRNWTGQVVQNTMDTDLYMASSNASASRNPISGVSNIDLQSLNNSDGTNAITVNVASTYVHGNIDIANQGLLSFSTYGGAWYMSDMHTIRAMSRLNANGDITVSTTGNAYASSFAYLPPGTASPLYSIRPSGQSVINNLVTTGTYTYGSRPAAGLVASGNVFVTYDLLANNSIYSPVYYDYSSNAYYARPASTSNLNAVTVATLTADNGIVDTGSLVVVGQSTLGSVTTNGNLTATNGATFGGDMTETLDANSNAQFTTTGTISTNSTVNSYGTMLSKNGLVAGSQSWPAASSWVVAQNGQVISENGVNVGSIPSIAYQGSCSSLVNPGPVKNGSASISYAGVIAMQAGGTGLYFCDGSVWHWLTSN